MSKDCASSCCEDERCVDDTDGNANCTNLRIPIWAVLLVISIVVLVIAVAIIIFCWLKRRHQEEIKAESEAVLSKDDAYERSRRSTMSMRRSIHSQKRDSLRHGSKADLGEGLMIN